MKNNKLARLAPLVVLAAAMMWGTVGMCTRYLYAIGFTPYQASMWRALAAGAIILPFMFLKHPGEMKLKSIRHLGYFLISGTFGLALCYTAYFLTIQASTLAVAAVMLYSSPIMVLIMARVIFKEALNPEKIFSLITAFAGCILMSGILTGGAGALSFKGMIIGFLSGLGYALYNIGSRLALSKYDTFAVTAYTFLFTVLGMIPFTFRGATGPMMTGHPFSILVLIIMGTVCTLVPYTIYVLALNYVEVGKASVIAFAEPVTATFLGLVFFHERLDLINVIAILLILLSVVVSVDPREKEKTK
jgi:drug/metabolite transporter (DMT)-like permease